jgi:YHS domain-containing protein
LSIKEINLSMIKNTFLFNFLLIGVLGVFACHQNPKSEESDASGAAATDTLVVKSVNAKPKFTAAMVDNKKDPNCGMPVTAGIADTIHFKGKVYGFCSDECRDAFLKNPDALVKNAELKN